MHTHRYRLVIFDCDGVLVDSEPLALDINRAMLAELGWYPTDREIIDRFLGRSLADCLDIITGHLGRPVPAGWADRFTARIHDAHERALRPVSGVEEALDGLAAAGIAVCVASSGTPTKIRHSLDLTGLARRFGPHLFSATQVPHGKPAPDLFALAAHTMGVPAADCAVIEDSRYGVQAARAAGMHAFGYTGGLTPAEWLAGPATTLVDDLRKLPGLLTG